MKIKLKCFYGDNGPGAVIDEKNEVQAQAMIDSGAAELVEGDAKPSQPAAINNKARKG